LLSVVNYLHGNKIVHRYELTLYNWRDLKPENILLEGADLSNS
jgi:serine/threonine protein kinase